jgi:hypothetical protein
MLAWVPPPNLQELFTVNCYKYCDGLVSQGNALTNQAIIKLRHQTVSWLVVEHIAHLILLESNSSIQIQN